MKGIFIILLLTAVHANLGCSVEVLKRTSYETLQNVKQQQCQESPSVECPDRETYNEYQKDINQLEVPK